MRPRPESPTARGILVRPGLPRWEPDHERWIYDSARSWARGILGPTDYAGQAALIREAVEALRTQDSPEAAAVREAAAAAGLARIAALPAEMAERRRRTEAVVAAYLAQHPRRDVGPVR